MIFHVGITMLSQAHLMQLSTSITPAVVRCRQNESVKFNSSSLYLNQIQNAIKTHFPTALASLGFTISRFPQSGKLLLRGSVVKSGDFISAESLRQQELTYQALNPISRDSCCFRINPEWLIRSTFTRLPLRLDASLSCSSDVLLSLSTGPNYGLLKIGDTVLTKNKWFRLNEQLVYWPPDKIISDGLSFIVKSGSRLQEINFRIDTKDWPELDSAAMSKVQLVQGVDRIPMNSSSFLKFMNVTAPNFWPNDSKIEILEKPKIVNVLLDTIPVERFCVRHLLENRLSFALAEESELEPEDSFTWKINFLPKIFKTGLEIVTALDLRPLILESNSKIILSRYFINASALQVSEEDLIFEFRNQPKLGKIFHMYRDNGINEQQLDRSSSNNQIQSDGNKENGSSTVLRFSYDSILNQKLIFQSVGWTNISSVLEDRIPFTVKMGKKSAPAKGVLTVRVYPKDQFDEEDLYRLDAVEQRENSSKIYGQTHRDKVVFLASATLGGLVVITLSFVVAIMLRRHLHKRREGPRIPKNEVPVYQQYEVQKPFITRASPIILTVSDSIQSHGSCVIQAPTSSNLVFEERRLSPETTTSSGPSIEYYVPHGTLITTSQAIPISFPAEQCIAFLANV
ncbi:hypothetical protein Ciccas_011795 [Cichlidogyrus casuarinus]|uniref:Uncharacterized protein n=1 Tax=Cichlidogyrus casuarinus TaxID=1844966 RepID=A0ABD2PRG4_9PLAT